MFKNKHIILGVSGSIAAYKSVELASKLTQAQADVNVIMTKAAAEFITPLSFRAITGNKTTSNFFSSGAMSHIDLTDTADCIVIAPATANTIAKLANGIADNALTSTALAADSPVFIVPAMNERMWLNSITVANVAALKARGFIFIGPEIGSLACNKIGIGRMSQPDDVIEQLKKYFTRQDRLKNKRIIVTAGGTREPIDQVRFVGNRSSGKMGYALALAARLRGADVCLISATSTRETPGVKIVSVRTAAEMSAAIMKQFPEADAVIMAAAVSDYRVVNTVIGKIKKSNEPLKLTLEPSTDILLELGRAKNKQILIGFAAETENLIPNAERKLVDKNLDFIVANDINQLNGGFESDNNQVSIVSKNEVERLPLMSKRELAEVIIDRLSEIII